MPKKNLGDYVITTAVLGVLLFGLASNLLENKEDPAGKKFFAKRAEKESPVEYDLYSRFKEEAKNFGLRKPRFSFDFIEGAKDTANGPAEEVKNPPGAGPRLNGIIWDNEKPAAIINEEVVEVSSKVGNMTVVSIRQDKVILSDGANNLELKLGE